MTKVHRSVQQIVEHVRNDGSCELLPAVGLPKTPKGIYLPDDISTFYSLCGGGILFVDRPHPVEILEPTQFVEANIVCLSELTIEEIRSGLGEEHFSWGWFVFAETGGSTEYVAINLKGREIGSCYDCFWETYPDLNNKLASSFTDFLNKIYNAQGMMHMSEIFD